MTYSVVKAGLDVTHLPDSLKTLYAELQADPGLVNNQNLMTTSTKLTVASSVTVSSSPNVTLGSAQVTARKGQTVTGSGIPADTVILSVTDSTHIVLSKNATASATVTVTIQDTLPVDCFQVQVTTHGVSGALVGNAAVPAIASVVPGSQVVVQLKALGHASDTVVLGIVNLVPASGTLVSVTLSVLGDFVRLRAFANGWHIEDSSSGVVVTS